MLKDKIPELQRLSPAEKFALAIELRDGLASSRDEIPVTGLSPGARQCPALPNGKPRRMKKERSACGGG